MERYISDLLYRYECVTVPGLGAFLTQRSSAKLDEEAQLFFPPKKRLSFNGQILENDGLLANHVAQVKQISYEAALNAIVSFSLQIKEQLDAGDTVNLARIGTLKKSAHGTLNFEPSPDVNYLTSSFGLESFAVAPAHRKVIDEPSKKPYDETPIFISDHKKNTAPWLKYAAIGLFAIGLSGIIGYSSLQNIEAHNVAAKEEAQNQLEQKIQQATFVISNPLPAINLQLERPRGKYHIVAGAFRIAENAAKHVDELQEKGYKARTIGANKYGLHQVVYNSFSDRAAALKALAQVRQNENSAAWMLVQEQDAQ